MRKPADTVFLEMAIVLAQRGSCARLKVGCILTNGQGRICGSGYNGPATGIPNCTDTPCPGANVALGKSTGTCESLHAEQNALIYCTTPFEIETCYATCAPCRDCLKMLMGTSCKRIVFAMEYPGQSARDMWLSMGREWVYLPTDLTLLGL